MYKVAFLAYTFTLETLSFMEIFQPSDSGMEYIGETSILSQQLHRQHSPTLTTVIKDA